jgi:hypothetical protein
VEGPVRAGPVGSCLILAPPAHGVATSALFFSWSSGLVWAISLRAQFYLYPYPPPPAPPYRAPADASDDGPPQVPYYRSCSRASEPRAGTEARAPVQSDPRTGDPRNSDPRFSALPPEDRPETGPRKELPPQFRRAQVDYFTKEPAGSL